MKVVVLNEVCASMNFYQACKTNEMSKRLRVKYDISKSDTNSLLS